MIALAAVALLVVFRNQVSGALGQYGNGLGTFGKGIQSFVSSVSSPSITPTIGLNLTGVFGDIQSGLNSWYQGTFNSHPQASSNTTSKASSPTGSTAGFNVRQSTQESGGVTYKGLTGDAATRAKAAGF